MILLSRIFLGLSIFISSISYGDSLEIEPNDETAQLISFDESIKGSISSSSDLDFYSVEAPGAGSLTLTMTTEGISQFSSQEFVYYIYDSANNILASESCTTACTTLTVALPASGGYGIGVQSSSTFSAPDGFYTVSYTHLTLPTILLV